MIDTPHILSRFAPQFLELHDLEKSGTPKPWTWDNKVDIKRYDGEEVYYHLPECSWLTGAIMYGSDNDEDGGIDAYFLEVVTKQLRPLLDDYARVLQENYKLEQQVEVLSRGR